MDSTYTIGNLVIYINILYMLITPPSASYYEITFILGVTIARQGAGIKCHKTIYKAI